MKKLELEVNRGNLGVLRGLIETLKSRNIPIVDIIFDASNPPDFFRLKSVLYRIINGFEEKSSIIFHNLPYCVLPDAEEHIINLESEKKIKIEDCRKCRFNSFCGGCPKYFLEKYKPEIKPVKDSLKQICIETTNECNLDCFFCFNKIAQSDEMSMESDKVFSIIDQAGKMGVEIIRFTGGEPLLDENLSGYIEYARNKGMHIWLNSNGTLTKIYTDSLIKNIDSILIPIHGSSNKTENKVTGGKSSLTKKIESIRIIRNAKSSMFIRTGTAINKYNEKELYKIFVLTRIKLGVTPEIYRLITDKLSETGTEDILRFFNQAKRFYNRYGIRYIMANSFPFCFFEDPDQARLFSLGGMLDDGRDRIIINTKGEVRPMYYSRDTVGGWRNIEKAWNSGTMKGLRNLKFLPKTCLGCRFKGICKGGSRIMARRIFGSYYREDPLLR